MARGQTRSAGRPSLVRPDYAPSRCSSYGSSAACTRRASRASPPLCHSPPARRRPAVHRRVRLRRTLLDVRALAGSAGARPAQVPAARQQRAARDSTWPSSPPRRPALKGIGTTHRRADCGAADRASRARDQRHLGNLRSAVAAAADHRLCAGLRRRARADRRAPCTRPRG